MIKTSKEASKRLITIHGWSGVLLGLALYVVVFTGAVVVLSHEIGSWAVSGHKQGPGLAHPELDETLNQLSTQVDSSYLEDVNIWQNSAGYVIAFFHKHTINDAGDLTEKGERFVLDPADLSVVSRAEGFHEDLPEVVSSYLEHFFVDLHVRLHAPDPFGLYLTGILGLVLLISAVSGLILHRHLLKDIFLSPRLASRIANTRDRHNLAGAWGIVFSILLAFTGAFFSFASTLGLPVIAITAFEGDQKKAIETVFGVPEKEDLTPQDFVGVETMLAQSQQPEIANSQPIFVVVNHWGRADALVTTIHEPNEGDMFFRQYRFSGVTGEFLGEKTGLGTQPSLGNTLNGLMGVLHFGWFAGVLSKIIWVALGLSVCYVILTGLQLWVAKRDKEPLWRNFSKSISIFGYGTPLAMSTAAIGFFMSYQYAIKDVSAWTINGFFFGVLLSVVIGFSLSVKKRASTFQQLLGLVLIALPLLRGAVSEQSIVISFTQNQFDVVVMDLTFFISGLLLLAISTGVLVKREDKQESVKGATA